MVLVCEGAESCRGRFFFFFFEIKKCWFFGKARYVLSTYRFDAELSTFSEFFLVLRSENHRF